MVPMSAALDPTAGYQEAQTPERVRGGERGFQGVLRAEGDAEDRAPVRTLVDAVARRQPREQFAGEKRTCPRAWIVALAADARVHEHRDDRLDRAAGDQPVEHPRHLDLQAGWQTPPARSARRGDSPAVCRPSGDTARRAPGSQRAPRPPGRRGTPVGRRTPAAARSRASRIRMRQAGSDRAVGCAGRAGSQPGRTQSGTRCGREGRRLPRAMYQSVDPMGLILPTAKSNVPSTCSPHPVTSDTIRGTWPPTLSRQERHDSRRRSPSARQ